MGSKIFENYKNMNLFFRIFIYQLKVPANPLSVGLSRNLLILLIDVTYPWVIKQTRLYWAKACGQLQFRSRQAIATVTIALISHQWSHTNQIPEKQLQISIISFWLYQIYLINLLGFQDFREFCVLPLNQIDRIFISHRLPLKLLTIAFRRYDKRAWFLVNWVSHNEYLALISNLSEYIFLKIDILDKCQCGTTHKRRAPKQFSLYMSRRTWHLFLEYGNEQN